jgi:succinate dehydrogenase hydrophobic anchor subunit
MTDEPDSEPTDEPADDGRDVRELLLRGTLLVLGVLAVVALFQFYTSANAAIGEWIGREFRSLFRAAFNLLVLLAAGIGISLVVRELT